MQVEITKQVFNSEQVTVKLNGSESAIRKSIAEAYAVVDERLLEMNTRMIVGSKFAMLMAKHFPPVWSALNTFCEIISGKTDLQHVPEELPDMVCPNCQVSIRETIQKQYAAMKAAEAEKLARVLPSDPPEVVIEKLNAPSDLAALQD